jgi:hypothetical protein
LISDSATQCSGFGLPAMSSRSNKRYELLCRRLVLERLYDAACLTLSTNEPATTISHPAADLTFRRFVAELQGSAHRFLASQR